MYDYIMEEDVVALIREFSRRLCREAEKVSQDQMKGYQRQ